ncbi:MAG: ribonuclease J, partial [Chloroflexota bacterium]
GMLRGIVLTHGHQDHIGGMPYLLQRLHLPGGVPVYGTALTIGMLQSRLEEMGVSQYANLQVIDDRQTVQLGAFRVSPFSVAHSIPAAVGLVIDTPVGAVVHTGDYKLDQTPLDGCITDLQRLHQLTPRGVLAMLGDSTNADRPGRTPTEQVVVETLDGLFAQAPRDRIIIATFSTVLARLQEILHLAHKYGRKVALAGRSLEQNVTLASSLGYLEIPKGLLVDIRKPIPDEQLVILSTGSQGEPRSALNLMALGRHKQVQVKAGDTIIVSGGIIPGNEEDVGRMLNHLFARGANVIYGRLADVHVSGHASRDELRAMLEAVRPRFLIPVHGELRHLHLHARLARETGLPAERIFVLQNGACWVTDGQSAWLEESVPAEDVYVDGALVGEVGPSVMQQRERLAQDGLVVVNVPINQQRQLAGELRFLTHGFVDAGEAEALMQAARAEIKRGLRQVGKRKQANQLENVQETLEDFFFAKTQSRPVIVPNFVKA